MIKYNSS